MMSSLFRYLILVVARQFPIFERFDTIILSSFFF